MRRLPLLLCCLLLVASGCDPGQAPRERPPAPVQFVEAEPRTIARTISSVGSFESPNMTTVASEIRGRVVSLDVPEGQQVAAGHVLARLDDQELRAALRVTRARLQNAEDRLARLRRLRDNSVSSEQAYEDALAEFDAAKAASEESQTQLDRATIRAPFAGVLGLQQVNVGQYVDAGTAIVELTQVDPLELSFGIPQRYASDLALEQPVRGRIGRCGPRFEGRVDAIDPRVDPSTRSLQLQARVPNPDGRLYPGMAGSLEVVVGEIADAVVVPQEAIVRQGTRHIVYTLDAEDNAEQRTVSLGQFFADGVQIRSGVEPNARVVAAGQQKLRPGAPTRPAPFEPTSNPNLALGSAGTVGGADDCESTP